MACSKQKSYSHALDRRRFVRKIGLTLCDLILKAGGLKEGADLLRAEVSRLQLDADQVDALHNLEVALQRMEQREQQQDQQQKQQQDQEQQDQEQQRQDQEQGRDQQEQGQEQQQQPPPEQQEPQDRQEPDDQSDDTGSEEPSPPPEGDQEQMSPEEAMSLLRALDRDEEQLKHSIQQRLRGGKPKSGKRW